MSLSLGTRIVFNLKAELPVRRSIIFVVNHQSTYDIPPIIWHLRKFHPKFISKIELGKGIPSVSFNLRHGGSVLIDRKKPLHSTKLRHLVSGFIKKITVQLYSRRKHVVKMGNQKKFQKIRITLPF